MSRSRGNPDCGRTARWAPLAAMIPVEGLTMNDTPEDAAKVLPENVSDEQALDFLDGSLELLSDTLGEFVPEDATQDDLIALGTWARNVAVTAYGLLQRRPEIEDERPDTPILSRVEDPAALRTWLLDSQREVLDEYADALDRFESGTADFVEVRHYRREADRTARWLEQFEWLLGTGPTPVKESNAAA